MTNWSALSSLSVWTQASRSSNAPGVLATAKLPEGLVTFLLGSRAAERSAETTEVVHLCIQNGKEFLQRKLKIDVKFPSSSAAPGAAPEAFQQILVAAGGRALALFSPSCCAIVSLHDFFGEKTSGPNVHCCEALVMSPSTARTFLKVAWHPMSDAHLGVLSSDGSWSLLNLALSLDEPEVHFPALVGSEAFVDFLFLAPGEHGRAETPEDLWLSLSVFFLTSSGRISFRNPVLPSTAVLSRRGYSALHTALASAATADTFAAGVAGSMAVSLAEENVVLTTHRHHLHGGAQPFSSSTGLLEQVLDEPKSFEASTSSSSFCRMQVCCSSPLVVFARGTVSGYVELVVLESAIGPYSGPARTVPVPARVLEEIDLMCNKSTVDDFIHLETLGDRPGILVHTRSLLASIDLSLHSGVLAASSTSSTSLSSVSTLAETRSNDMDFASWSLVDSGVGLLLRMERAAKDAKPKATSGSKSFLTVIELKDGAKAGAGATAAANFGGHSSKLSPSSLHLLEQPLGPSKAAPSMKPAELAKRVATLRSGIASIQCRQDFLKHLAEKSFPARAEVLRQELQLDSSKLRQRCSEGAKRAKELQMRQEELVQRQQALVKALGAAAEARHLEELNDAAVPKLYAQLYELRRAAELLRSSQRALTFEAPEGRPTRKMLVN